MRGNHIILHPVYFCGLFIHLVLFIFLPGYLFADVSPYAALEPSENSLTIKGYFSTKYIYRKAQTADGRVSDQDLFGELRIDTATPKDNAYEFHLFGTVRDDLGGERPQTGFYPFEDIGDTYRSRIHGYLYEAHLDINNLFRPETQLRIGRQAGRRDEPLFFDGGAVDISGPGLSFTLYGGAAVHFFEISNHWGDDTVAGAGLDYSPSRSTIVSLDYLSVEDEHAFPAPADLRDRMISVKVWQSIGSSVKGTAKYRFLNGEPRDVSVRAISIFPDADTEVNINYFRQFRHQNELSQELSLYNEVLGRSAPYQSYDIKARKFFGPHYALDLGYFKRALLEDREETAFDRDFSRAFLLFELIDLPKDGLSFTLITDRWETTGREYNSAGLDIGYKFKSSKNAAMNMGTYYSLYKYDYYVEQAVKEKVRTYYINGRYLVGKRLSLNGGYEYEASIENYQTFKLGMRYDF